MNTIYTATYTPSGDSMVITVRVVEVAPYGFKVEQLQNNCVMQTSTNFADKNRATHLALSWMSFQITELMEEARREQLLAEEGLIR